MAATSFFGGTFFGGEFFNVAVAEVPLGGKGDNERRRARGIPVKPTGLLHRPIPQGRKEVEDRAADSAQIAADVAARVAREFDVGIWIAKAPTISAMSMEQIDAEIGARLRKKLQEEEDLMLMIAMIAAAS